jgi:hypothetical protein
MEKLYKVGQWLWRNKERMVLVILVFVLAYQVFQVVQHKPDPTLQVPRAGTIRDTPPDTIPSPEPFVSTPTGKDYAGLNQRNPFWVYSSTGEKKDASGTTEAADPAIRLLNIQALPDGGHTARIQTQGTQWYKEGEQFESYKLLKIDAENRQVEVYSEKLGKSITLKIQ